MHNDLKNEHAAMRLARSVSTGQGPSVVLTLITLKQFRKQDRIIYYHDIRNMPTTLVADFDVKNSVPNQLFSATDLCNY